MVLYPVALAKAAAIFMFCLGLVNCAIVFVYFPPINPIQLIIPLLVTPLIAAVGAYAFARLYNYFIPSSL